MYSNFFKSFIYILITILFSACGGGGGGSTPAPSAPPVIPTVSSINVDFSLDGDYTQGTPSTVDTNTIYDLEYNANKINAQINAGSAYEDGWTAEGVKVAVLDSGIDTDHIDLNLDPNNIYSVQDYNLDAINGEDDDGHGTAVIGIIGATNNDSLVHGVAYDADLYSIKVLDDTGSTFESVLVHGLNLATSLGVKVTNISIGSEPPSTLSTAFVDDYRNALSNDNTLIFAAGNESGICQNDGTGCNTLAALPLTYTDLADSYNGAWIVVGAVDSNNEISSYSNQAGVLQDIFMVAPGGDFGDPITTTSNDGSISNFIGTSFAAPAVTGAFALISQKYPYLTGTDIRNILFASATDLGETGIDEVYGHGLLNIDGAMQPIGSMSIPVSNTISGTSLSLSSTSLSAPSSLSKSIANYDLIIIDNFNRPFNVGINSSINYYDETYSYHKSKIFESKNEKLFVLKNNNSLGIGYKDFKNRFSVLVDKTLMGIHSTGAFSIKNPNTFYFNYERYLKNGFSSYVSLSYANASNDTESLIYDISDIYGYGVGLFYENRDIKFSLNIPNTIFSGNLDMKLPINRDFDGNIIYENQKIDLSKDRYSLESSFKYEFLKNDNIVLNSFLNYNFTYQNYNISTNFKYLF